MRLLVVGNSIGYRVFGNYSVISIRLLFVPIQMRKQLLFFLFLVFVSTPFAQLVPEQQVSKAVNALELRCDQSSDLEVAISKRTPEFRIKAKKNAAILDDLSNRRNRFLDTGDYLEVFPALYFNTTVIDLDHILHIDSNKAAFFLDVMLVFYDAFETNRRAYERGGVGAVEPHWRGYYRRASQLNRKRTASEFDLLMLILDGVDAHLADLPRALRFVSVVYRTPLDAFKSEYDSMDSLFSSVVERFYSDIQQALKIRSRIISLEGRFGFGSNYVIYARQKAWEIASKNLPLRTKKPQPVLHHRELNEARFIAVLDMIGCPAY